MKRTAALVLLPLLGGCAAQPTAPLTAEQARQNALTAACRREAERVVLFRDRGQTMRNDDMDARMGVSGNLSSRAESDRLGATFERDRIAAECVRSNSGEAAPAADSLPTAAPVAAPAAPAAPATGRRSRGARGGG
ncbi:hypothetical protein LPC08_06895 [Roseomonas sp. OT10]|uniref:hypothetical protein n=1 Tax=Roseomonas cutis TaxID=2897332 RepID=UPI001E5E8467|nr:hypothetical protein [Roseomonas sp. OT10]UFN50345.1 hypothetical protein LPC08_06895 [Roseomonas sp. OT10]